MVLDLQAAMFKVWAKALVQPFGDAAVAHMPDQHDEGFGMALGNLGEGPVIARQVLEGALQRVEDRPVAR